MPTTNDKRNAAQVRAQNRAGDLNNEQTLLCADPGDSMWPLTSEGAASVRVEKTKVRSRPAHPSVPRTLCDADAGNAGCSGWVAEPMN
jgi:hypothetical protein